MYRYMPIQLFELSLSNDSQIPDLQAVVEGMISKKPSLSDVLRNGKLVFKVESDRFPNRFVDVRENSQ
jgi:hypothetical protein